MHDAPCAEGRTLKPGFWQSTLVLAPDEQVRWFAGARRGERWAARGGRLVVTSERVVFMTSNFEKYFVSRWPDGGKWSVRDRDWVVPRSAITDVSLIPTRMSSRTLVAWNWHAAVGIELEDGTPEEFIVRIRERTAGELRAALDLAGLTTPRPRSHDEF